MGSRQYAADLLFVDDITSEYRYYNITEENVQQQAQIMKKMSLYAGISAGIGFGIYTGDTVLSLMNN